MVCLVVIAGNKSCFRIKRTARCKQDVVRAKEVQGIFGAGYGAE